MNIAVIGSASGQPQLAIRAAYQRSREASMVILRMAHEFDAELVLSEREIIYIPDWHEMVELVGAADIGKRHHTLLRKRHIKLELAEFEVQPWRSQ